MKKLLLGGHWAPIPEGWEDWPESKQDMTKPFPLADNSVDALFSCHVIEHLSFLGAITFFKEAHRILKPRGIIRTVCPFLFDMIRSVRDVNNSTLYRSYFKNSIAPYYPNEIKQLENLGIDPYVAFPQLFFDSLLKNHNHRMIWESDVMGLVLKKVGFSEINICLPGESAWDRSMCLERRIRGTDKYLVEATGRSVWDPEGSVVEARK